MGSEAFSKIERELLAHSTWVRRLARSLVASEADAEELVQDTWVAALRRPPVEGSPARPWLARVVRNLAARRWRRSDVSLESPEALSSAGSDDLLDFTERLETQRILVEELQALAEPARRVIMLRYFGGLDAAEIARRTGEPHGTVRWRLHDALAELRTRLDRRHGGAREGWMRALTFGSPPLVLPPAPHAPHAARRLAPQASSAPLAPASLAVSTGILAVNTLAKLVIVTVVLVLSVGVYVTTKDAPVAPVLETPASVQAAPWAAPLPSEANTTQLVDGATTPVRAAIDAPSAAAPQVPAPAAVLKGSLVVRCIDEHLRALPGAWLSSNLSLTAGTPEASPPVARAGQDGELRLDIDLPSGIGQTSFVAGCDGFATRWLRVHLVPGGIAYAGDIVFAPAGTVAGRVIDERGAPVGGAEITVTTPSEGHATGDLDLMRVRGPEFDIGAPSAKSGDDGRFHVGGVPVGLARVWARASGTRWSVSAPLEISAQHETRDIELALERENPDAARFGPIEGIVLAPDETPVKSPNISVLYSEGNSSTSTGTRGEMDGRFKIVPIGHGPHELTFSDADSRYTPVRLQDVAPGTHGLIVHLGEPKPVAVVVRSHGDAVTEFQLTWREVGARDDHAAAKTKTHPDGRAILMAPPASFTFIVDAEGFLPTTMGPYDGRHPPTEIDVALEPVPGVHGRVLAAGQPVPGARVWLQTFGRHMKVQVNEFDLFVEPREQFVTTSDAEGRFRLGLQHDGEFMLFAEATGWAKSELGPLELVASIGQKGIELALDAGGAIEGHVLMPRGRNPAGTIVGVNHGEGKPRTQTVGPDGRFRFEELTPGGWKVMRCHSDFSGSTSTAMSSGDSIEGGTIDTNCVVVSGRTTRYDVDLRDSAPCVLVLELKVNGEPAKAWTATLWPRGVYAISRDLPQGATDAQGRARIEAEDPGSYEVHLGPAAESATALQIRLSVDLVRGTTPLAHDLKTGRVEGTLLSWHDNSEHGWRYESGERADFQASVAIRADANGHFVLPIVPAGPGRILHDIATEPHTGNFVGVADFIVEAGKTSTVSVP